MISETLTFINERGESILFSPSSLYHVNMRDVTGLSDIRNAIYRINTMGQDGDTYLGSRIESREIEIVGHIKERGKNHASLLRRRLNHILNPHYTATLVYEGGGIKRLIGCTVDNAPVYIRTPIYEQFTIQLVCLNPFWREEAETRGDVASWIGSFEFPLPEGLEIPFDEGWEIGYRQQSWIVNIYNAGDVRSGIKIVFRALGVVQSPSLLNVNTGEFIKFNINMESQDVLTVSTGYGEKTVTLLHGGALSDAYRYIDVDSSYLQLAVGDNIFRYDAEANVENLEVSIYYNNYFLGV